MKKLLTLLLFAFSFSISQAQTPVDTLTPEQGMQRILDSIQAKNTVNSITKSNIAARYRELWQYLYIRKDSTAIKLAAALQNYNTHVVDSILLDAKLNKTDSNQAYYNAKKLQGIWLSPLSPTSGQVLAFNGSYAYWLTLPPFTLQAVVTANPNITSQIYSTSASYWDSVVTASFLNHYLMTVGDSLCTTLDSAWNWGTSITVGQGASVNTLGYAYRLNAMIDYVNVNKGIASTKLVKVTTGDSSMEDRLYSVPYWRSGIGYASLEYGINDNTDTATWRAKYSMILDTFLARGYAGHFFTIAPSPRVGVLTTEAQYTTILKNICFIRGIKCIDNYNYLLQFGTANLLVSDSIHLNNFGHLMAASHIYEFMPTTIKKHPVFNNNANVNNIAGKIFYGGKQFYNLQIAGINFSYTDPSYSSVGQQCFFWQTSNTQGGNTLGCAEVANASQVRDLAWFVNSAVALKVNGTDTSVTANALTLNSLLTFGANGTIGNAFSVYRTPSYGSVGNANYMYWVTGSGTTDSFALKSEATSGSHRQWSFISRTGSAGIDQYNMALKNDGTVAFSTIQVLGLLGSGIPTLSASTGAGTSPTKSISGFDLDGTILLTTGTTPSANAIICTVTFHNTRSTTPHVVLTPSNANAAALSGATAVWVPDASQTNGVTTGAFVIMAGSSALTAATAYSWTYQVLQ